MAKCSCLLKSGMQVERVSELINPPTIDVNFGRVPFTSRRSKEIVLDFEGKEIDQFFIKVSEIPKEYDDVFIITPTEGFGKKGTKLKFKCTFVPRIAYQRYFAQFELCLKDKLITIAMKGDSIGTSLTISKKIVELFQHPRNKLGRAVLELRNTSAVPAEFSINFDSKQKLFSVTPTSGVCKDVTFIAINFNSPEKFGVYFQQINCLVYGCSPIIINVLGVYTKKILSPEKATIIRYPFNFEEKCSYRACFHPVTDDKEKPYPVVLNPTFLDLGRALVKELFDEESTVITKNFSLTNKLDTEINVNWIEDDKVFSIFPQKVTVKPHDRMYFKCVFSPTYSQTCFCRTFTAQVNWKPHNIQKLSAIKNLIIAPLTISITVQGHSYPEDQMPMGHLEMVNNVIEFAASLPNEYVYQNFKITNTGTRPTMFKLVPPDTSRVIMIPMCGIIKDFIVILAQYKSIRRVRTLVEHWKLILNGQDEKILIFKVVGYTELPSLRVGPLNEISFQSTQIHTIARKKELLYNLSNFNINFKFVEPDHGYIKFEPVEGIISRRDVLPITVIFKATPCCPNVNKVLIVMHALQNLNLLIGPSCEHYFTVYATSTYSELSATPLVDEFYLLEYGTIINTSFQLHNFGISTVFFKIVATNIHLCSDVLIIDPIFGQVDPNNSIIVNLSLECKTLGLNSARIEYFARSDAETKETAKDATTLLTFSYACQISILKISEIVEHTFGPLFSKRDFWSFLKIDCLNELLNSLRPHETKPLTINLPDCPLGNQHYITLAIENTTDLDTEIQLKRIQLCDCKKTKTPSPYRIEYTLHCVHRDTLHMEISQALVDKRTTQKITINVSYCIVGLTQMAYEVYLRPDRKIILYFNIFGIHPNTSRASVYNDNFTVDMCSGFLTAKNPPSQIFWFYNNSSISAVLDIDLSDVRRLNEESKYDIFECTYSQTPISPGGIWPLMIKFLPNEHLQKYKVKVNILMNEEAKLLKIQGYGIIKPSTEEFFECRMPQECKSTNDFPMKFSKDNIMIKCLPTWRFAEHLLFIENLTTTKLLYYEFEDVDIDGLVKIVVLEKSGILRPGKSKTVTIKVQSFDESVLANFNLPCTVTDLQMMYALKKKKTIQVESEKSMAYEFQFNNPEIKTKEPNKEQWKSCMQGPEQISYSMIVTVSVNIVDRKDLLAFTDDPNNILQFNIPETIPVNTNCAMSDSMKGLICTTNRDHESLCGNITADVVEHIFEKVLSDVLFNEAFTQIISSIFEDVPLYYSQLALDDRPFEEKSQPLEDAALKEMKEKETDKFFSRPTEPILSETFTSLIKDSLRKTFDLTSPSQQLADEQAIKDTMEHLKEICTLKECLCPSQKIC